MKYIDAFLNQITMYRLVLYFLCALIFIATVMGAFGFLPYRPNEIILSTLLLVSISWLTNTLIAKFLNVPTNIESVYISALILELIIAPKLSLDNLWFLGWAAFLTQASKYILTINKKHLFNPVAAAVVVTALFLNQSANWWVGTRWFFPFVLIFGLLIVRKIRRSDLVFSFLITAFVTILSLNLLKGLDPILSFKKVLLDTPILFFAFIMLTEPLTTPPTANLQILYGCLVGFLFAPQIHFGDFYTTPELSLIIGNIFSYIVSPKTKLLLKLKEKVQLSPDIYDFVFAKTEKFNYLPGQYMEWTLPHSIPDSRGNRRYFTLSSSPTEDELRLGIKFYPKSSSYKKALLSMTPGDQVLASQISGDFVLPSDPNKQLVFIAGGIGITPFRSMIKYLVDTKQKRDIILIYTDKTEEELIYKEIFDQTADLGIKIIYTLTDNTQISPNWKGKTGRISRQLIIDEIPNYKDRTYYLSGPHNMVTAFQDTLSQIGVKPNHIKIDFFPGFA